MKKLYQITIIYLLVAAINLYGQETPLVEPPFWWTGFKNTELQLMVYAKDISKHTPVIKYKNVIVKKTHSIENPNYLFIDLELNANTQPGTFNIDFVDSKKKTAYTFLYQLKERVKNSSERMGFNSTDAIYLITPDRFANGDISNDTHADMKDTTGRSNWSGRHGGDIQGIIDNLDYIDEMGFTAIWINPLIENDMYRDSYHGYAATNFYKTDPRYGTNEDYLLLCKKAQERGIKVISDMIFNHCGSEHYWMKDLPSKDWFNNNGEYGECNHRRTVYSDPYASAIDKKGMTEGWFVREMPDLNQNNPFVANYLTQNSIWWIEHAGLGGIRMDTWPYPEPDMMNQWSCRIEEEYPNFSIVGEEWSMNPAVIASWQKGTSFKKGQNSCLKSLFDFPTQESLVKALTQDETWGTGWVKLYESFSNDFLYPSPYDLVVFPDNHDMNRFFKQVNEDVDLFRMGLTFILTTRGIPQIYYGTEIHMNNPKTDKHEEIRSDFPGGWPGDKVNAFTNEGLSNEKIETKEYVKTLLNYRKTSDLIHHGKLMHFAPENGIYVFFRYNESEALMVVFNKNKTSTKLKTDRFEERLTGYTKGVNITSKEEVDISSPLSLPPMKATILELKR